MKYSNVSFNRHLLCPLKIKKSFSSVSNLTSKKLRFKQKNRPGLVGKNATNCPEPSQNVELKNLIESYVKNSSETKL